MATDKQTNKKITDWLKAHADGVTVDRKGDPLKTKLFDGGGLHLIVNPSGSASWRIKYSFLTSEGLKDRTYSVGVYPEIDLEQAREERTKVRAMLKEGSDPVKKRLVTKQTNIDAGATTFAGAAETWLAKLKPTWSAVHYRTTSQALRRDVLPALGALPVRELTAVMITRVIRAIKKRTGTNETAQKVLWTVRSVLEEERAEGRITTNPTPSKLAVLGKGKQEVHRPALETFEGLGDVLRRVDTASISPAVRIAHRLVAFTASRIGNVVEARWSEFDLDGKIPTWTIPREQMKVKERPHDHRVLLGPTITNELRRWREATGGKGHLFPPPFGKAPTISREAIEKMYRVTLNLRGTHSVHGWRASFATLAKEAGAPRDAVELALDHVHDSAVVRAYDRGQRYDERLVMMRWWDANLSAAQRGEAPVPYAPDTDPRVLPFARTASK